MKRTTWIFLALLAIAIGAYFLIKYTAEKNSAEVTPFPETGTYLFQEIDTLLSSIRITDQEYHIFEMKRNQDGFWGVTLPKAGIADQALASAAETQIGALRIVTDIGQVDSLSDFGLASPAHTIKLAYSNGNEYILKIGDSTPTGSGYYVQLDEEGLYVVSQYSLDAVLNLVSNPPFPATATPTLELAISTPEAATTVP